MYFFNDKIINKRIFSSKLKCYVLLLYRIIIIVIMHFYDFHFTVLCESLPFLMYFIQKTQYNSILGGARKTFKLHKKGHVAIQFGNQFALLQRFPNYRLRPPNASRTVFWCLAESSINFSKVCH